MKLLAIRYTNDTEECMKFYQALGLNLDEATASEHWMELKGGESVLALHTASAANFPKDGIEICFVAEQPLEDVQAALITAGFDGGEIKQEDFGKSLRVTDPSGLALQINNI